MKLSIRVLFIVIAGVIGWHLGAKMGLVGLLIAPFAGYGCGQLGVYLSEKV